MKKDISHARDLQTIICNIPQQENAKKFKRDNTMRECYIGETLNDKGIRSLQVSKFHAIR